MNQKDTNLNAIEGEERGIPSANEDGSRSGASRGQKLGFILLVLLCLGFLIFMTLYNRKKETEDTEQNSPQESTLPAKTFEMPPPPKVAKTPPPPPLPVATQNNNTSTVLPVEAVAPSPPSLDKSGSSMFPSSTTNNGSISNTNSGIAQSNGNPRGVNLVGSSRKAQASYIGDRNFILPKGAFLDCVLQTRLDSTVVGASACTLTRNVYSDNGKVLLLERGSQVIGEYKANLKQGQKRIFVLWTRIKTPHGVVIDLNSPGTDSLGGSGLSGHVKTHFWRRFGSAILLSMIDDAFAYAANRYSSGRSINGSNGGARYSTENTQENTQNMATEALKNSINIPPTLYINQGARINIYVAQDLDFSEVYDVQASH